MSQIAGVFQDALIEDFGDPTFLRLLNGGVEIDYNEAGLRTHKDALISNPFKSYAFGHDRYFLTQSRFYESALQGNLDPKVIHCPSNGYPITHLKFGRFLATYHFGKSPNRISCPQTSLLRKQQAGCNKELIEPKLPGMSTEGFVLNEKTFGEASQIYINIIHGCHGHGRDFRTNGFLRIALPYYRRWVDAETKRTRQEFGFVENVDLRFILGALIEKERGVSQAPRILDIAVPKIKKAVGDNQ